LADLIFRFPEDSDWQHILSLANDSVRHVPGAGDQSAWLANRREFPSERCREHFVAVENDKIAGYAAMEELPGDNLRFRLFVVTLPSARANVGESMIRRLLARLQACAAAEARFVEYASDQGFVAFLEARGFHRTGNVAIGNDLEAAVLTRVPPY
jgi:N-acetylglutamate synthase-like GNAT family acetyltransferase